MKEKKLPFVKKKKTRDEKKQRWGKRNKAKRDQPVLKFVGNLDERVLPSHTSVCIQKFRYVSAST
jgi:hypothetical protein